MRGVRGGAGGAVELRVTGAGWTLTGRSARPTLQQLFTERDPLRTRALRTIDLVPVHQMLLLLQTAFALPVISVPLTADAPPAGWVGTSARLPLFASAAKPWVSDFARVTCTSEKGWLSAEYDLAGEPATSLPERVTCTQGRATVHIGLRFVAPEPDAWMTDEGVFILPVPGPRGAWAKHSLRVSGLSIAAAETPDASSAIRCTFDDGVFRLESRGADAPAEAVCRITPKGGGAAVDHRLLVVPYRGWMGGH